MSIRRREWLLLAPVARALAGGARFRLAMCNDAFHDWPFPEMCRAVKKAGFDGVELTPSTLTGKTSTLRDAMASEGLRCAGLHNILTAPTGLHATTADAIVRRRSWDHLRRLVDLTAALGGSVLVFGSGKQRSAADGMTVAEATARLRDGLAELVPAANARGVIILLEPLAPQFTNVVNTLDEAAAIVRQVGSPAVQTMFDTHNTVAEKLPHDELIRRHFPHIRHVHLNEMDGRHPGTGDYDFRKVLQTLKDLRYGGWVSVEVFDFKAGARTIAEQSAAFLRKMEGSLT